jgi:hypothetical protein
MSTSEDYLANREEMITLLGVSPFINACWHNILFRIEEKYQNARDKITPSTAFMDEAVTISSAIIQIGSPLESFRSAVEKTKERFPKKDYMMVLSLIVLKEIACQRLNLLSQWGVFGETKEMWQEILFWIEETEI